MHRSVLKVLCTGCIAALAAGAADAQTPKIPMPTYSVAASAVNDVQVPGGTVSHVAVAPGDVITAKIMVRDWSPQGQKLRAYQVKIDSAGYTSGTSGTVQPVGYKQAADNEANAFIDKTDSTYVHKGLESIPLVDTASEGYRWLTVLLNAEEGPVSPQDGTKFSCGTVRLQASTDAAGTFKIGLVDHSGASGLLDPASLPIEPLAFEPLTVEIRLDARWLRIEGSEPASGSIDGRIILTPAGRSGRAWDQVKLRFNGDATGLGADDFVADDGSTSPPGIVSVSADGSQAVVRFDRGIRPNAWTTVTHKASGSSVRLGLLPGDVNNDGRRDADDLVVLIQNINGGSSLSLVRCDLDGDGTVSSQDVLAVIDLLTSGHPLRVSLPKPEKK